jgi:hypothetical protein
MARHSILFLLAIGVSFAYLLFAVRKLGIWGGVAFLVIWVSVFVYQRGKRKQS